MKYLPILTPAETSIILTGDQTPLRDLLKYTFMDLLLKKVLAIHEVERQASHRDPIRVHKYVFAGENFVGYCPMKHELPFLSIFQKQLDISVLFRNLVSIAYEQVKSEKSYYAKIVSSANLKQAIKTSIIQKVVGGFSFTAAGFTMRAEIQEEFSTLEKHLSEHLKTNRSHALQLLRSIGGNVFLFKVLEFKILEEFENELLEQMSKANSTNGCSSGCWTDVGDFGDAFDSSCGSDGGAGCSGDAGGGDGGCGGCSGGCGGD